MFLTSSRDCIGVPPIKRRIAHGRIGHIGQFIWGHLLAAVNDLVSIPNIVGDKFSQKTDLCPPLGENIRLFLFQDIYGLLIAHGMD